MPWRQARPISSPTSAVITLTAAGGAAGGGAGFGSVLAVGVWTGAGSGTVGAGFGGDEHAARNTAHRKLRMREP